MYSLSPERILQLELGFCAAQALVAAIELGLFTELGKGPRSARQLRRALGLSARAIPDLPDTLVALGLLEREGDDGDAVYINTRESSHFLDRRSTAYIGQDLAQAHARSLTLWSRLGDALRTGQAQGGPGAAAPVGLSLCWGGPAQLARALSELLDFAALRRVVHLGGGRAGLCGQLAALHPEVDCRNLELAATDWPEVDLVIASQLHACTLAEKQALLARVHAVLPPGGGLLVLDHLIDDERRRNTAGLLVSLNMLVELGDAFAFSAADCKQWCLEAGFATVEALVPTAPWVAGLGAVLARK